MSQSHLAALISAMLISRLTTLPDPACPGAGKVQGQEQGWGQQQGQGIGTTFCCPFDAVMLVSAVQFGPSTVPLPVPPCAQCIPALQVTGSPCCPILTAELGIGSPTMGTPLCLAWGHRAPPQGPGGNMGSSQEPGSYP